MSPGRKDLGKIHGIGNAKWFNLKFKRTEGKRRQIFRGWKGCFCFLISYQSLDREKQLLVLGVIRFLGSLREKTTPHKNPWLG